jgi:hypothetical protein
MSKCRLMESDMTQYRVRRFDSGKWQQEPQPILAKSQEEAAQLACRQPVLTRGKRACAEVWPIGGLPSELATFYAA